MLNKIGNSWIFYFSYSQMFSSLFNIITYILRNLNWNGANNMNLVFSESFHYMKLNHMPINLTRLHYWLDNSTRLFNNPFLCLWCNIFLTLGPFYPFPSMWNSKFFIFVINFFEAKLRNFEPKNVLDAETKTNNFFSPINCQPRTSETHKTFTSLNKSEGGKRKYF